MLEEAMSVGWGAVPGREMRDGRNETSVGRCGLKRVGSDVASGIMASRNDASDVRGRGGNV